MASMRKLVILNRIGIGSVVGLLALWPGCGRQAAGPESGLARQARDLFGVLPEVMASADNPVTPAKVTLGRALFYESRVSVDGTVSCARCHPMGLYAADGLPKSVGNRCRVTSRNAPTVLNAAAQISAHWVGDRTGVEDQAERSLVGAASFGMPSFEKAAARLRAIPGYAAMFREAFPGQADPVTVKNFALAVGAFERTLVTPAPFDAFLAGERPGLTSGQERGLRGFIEAGCAGCHAGPYFGGRSYEKFGVAEPYWTQTHSPEIDAGRFNVTKAEADRYVFKVPILRNADRTAPYFHDGSVSRLDDAVRIMGKVQLGTDLEMSRVADLVEFLKTLTGRLPPAALEIPILPPDFPTGSGE
jgi:cytochrome c peroxidase